MDTIGIGVIGVANMGAGHSRGLQEGKVPGARLAGVCDLDPEVLENFPDVPAWTDAAEMFAEGQLDAVIIATPHFAHVPLGIAALEAGLHVLVEKPIAVHKADAEKLIAAHRNPDQIFSAMFNQRTDPRYQWVRERIQDGTLGRVNRANWIITDWFRPEAYYRNGDWRATWAGEGGGVLVNQCPHQLDLWQWLFGMPARIRGFCQLGRFHEIEVEDDVTAYLEYEDGMTGVFITTTGEAPGTNRLEIAAENGRVIIEGSEIRFDKTEMPVSEFCATTEELFAAPKTEPEVVTLDSRGEQHLGILKNFAAAIRGEEALIAPAQEGIHSVELANAILLSGLTGETMNLPLDGSAFETRLQQLIENSTFKKKTVKKRAASALDMDKSF